MNPPANSSPVHGFTAAGKAVSFALDDDGGLILSDGEGEGVADAITGSVVSSAHTITAGAKAVTLVASSDFVGTVATVALNGSESITFRASPGNTLGAIAITRSAGSLRVWEQR